MEFSIFLSCYLPDTGYPARRMYDDMMAEAKLAETLGYCGVTVPEHHFMNILSNPSPLMLAVKVASVTRRVPITTAVLVLAYADMKRMAGEIALADCLTDGRLRLGVGRGAFPYEFERFGLPIEDSRAAFDEGLAVLEALLTREEVSWDSEHYKFPPLTIMPRPLQKPCPPIWIAALAPTAIYHCGRRGHSVQTTPLKATPELVTKQANAFFEGQAEAGEAAANTRLAMLRVAFVARDEADAKRKELLAHGYYRRFTNVFESPGTIRHGAIDPIDIAESPEELGASLLIGTAEQVIDKLRIYADAGIHEVNLNMNIGAPIEETLKSIERFATEVMPHFADAPKAVGVA